MNLEDSPKNEASRSSTTQKYRVIGKQIWIWSQGRNVSKKEVKNYAKKLFLDNGINDFKASDGWYRRWVAKWKAQKESTKIKDCLTKSISKDLNVPSSSTRIEPKNDPLCLEETSLNQRDKDSLKITNESAGRATEFIKWLQEVRQQGNSVNSNTLKKKVADILKNCKDSDSWFLKYASRLQNETNDKCHIMYPSLFKKELASLSCLTSINHVSKVFNVDRKRIRDWCHRSIGDNKKNASLYLTNDKIDKEIWQWYENQEAKPSSTEVREKALTLYRAAGFTQINCTNGWYYRWQKRYNLQTATGKKKSDDDKLICWLLGEFECHRSITRTQLLQKASQLIGLDQVWLFTTKKYFILLKPSTSWAVRFLKRNMLILQENPDVNTKLPYEIELNINQFKDNLKQILNCDPRKIIAFDEIPLSFEPPGKTPI